MGCYWVVGQLCGGVVHEGYNVGYPMPGCTHVAVLDLDDMVCEWVDMAALHKLLCNGIRLYGWGSESTFSNVSLCRDDLGFKVGQTFSGDITVVLGGREYRFTILDTREGFSYVGMGIKIGYGIRLLSMGLVCDSGDGVYRFDVLGLRWARVASDWVCTLWMDSGDGSLLGYRSGGAVTVCMDDKRWDKLMARVAKSELLHNGRMY